MEVLGAKMCCSMVGSIIEYAPKAKESSCVNLATDEAIMMDRFLLADFEQYLYRLYHNCIQGHRMAIEYTYEFSLAERNSLDETDGQ
ncbi:unnamed protein product [Prunus armeniaca]